MTSTIDMHIAFTLLVAARPGIIADASPNLYTNADDPLHEEGQPILLETRYGLRVEAHSPDEIRFRLVDSSTPVDNNQPAFAKAGSQKYHYDIAENFQASYLSNDAGPNHVPNREDHQHYVHPKTIEERHPALSGYWESWRDAHEECFRNRDHLLCPNFDVPLIWKVEGLLMVVWLVLQKDVSSVWYKNVCHKPGWWLFEKDTIVDTFLQMIEIMSILPV
jgi:hypothetical protein